jgi:hypothetical protein
MVENVMHSIGGTSVYGVISICLFVAVFIGVLVWTIGLKKPYLDSMCELPLDRGASGDRDPVAAGILPAVEPGILPGGMAVPRNSSAGPGGRMPPSTAGRMPAATGQSVGGNEMPPLENEPAPEPGSAPTPKPGDRHE